MQKKACASEHFPCASADEMSAEFTAARVNSEIRSMVVNTIEGMPGNGSVKSRIRDAARRLGLSVDRVRQFYYNRVRRIEAHEAAQIIRRAEQAKLERADRLLVEYEALRLEMANSAPSRLARLLPPSLRPVAGERGESGDEE